MVVVAEEDHVHHGGNTFRNGQARHCRRCCAMQTAEVDGQRMGSRWALQRRRLSEYANDAWTLRELISYVEMNAS